MDAASSHSLSVKKIGKDTIFTRRVGHNINNLSPIETIPLYIEASLEAIAKYRSLTRDPLSKIYNHSVLPCIIALIFSMSATSVNCERSFSDLNNRIGDKRHNLSNESLH